MAGKKTGGNPTDRGKEGAKRSLLTDGNGVPVGLAVDGANRHDMRMVRETLRSIPVKRPRPTRRKPQGLCLDKGYDYDSVRKTVKRFRFTAHIRSRGEEAKQCRRGTRARRWVVERSHSWFNRFRGLLVRWSKKSENYAAHLRLVCGIIAFRAAGLLG